MEYEKKKLVAVFQPGSIQIHPGSETFFVAYLVNNLDCKFFSVLLAVTQPHHSKVPIANYLNNNHI